MQIILKKIACRLLRLLPHAIVSGCLLLQCTSQNTDCTEFDPTCNASWLTYLLTANPGPDFIAVADQQTYLVSQYGQWTAVDYTTISGNTLFHMATTGSSNLLATDIGAMIMYRGTVGGKTWTEQTLTAAIAGGGEVPHHIAACSTGAVVAFCPNCVNGLGPMFSYDSGASWSHFAIAGGGGTSFKAHCTNGAMYVAFADSGGQSKISARYNQAGSWNTPGTPASFQAAVTGSAITANGSETVVVDNTGTSVQVWHSPSGADNFTNVATFGTNNFFGALTYGDGKYMAMMWNAAGTTCQFIYSTTGLSGSWNSLLVACPNMTSFKSLVVKNGVYKAAGTVNNTTPIMYTSSDGGNTWTQETLPTLTSATEIADMLVLP
ncbi:MAG: hypothetical protein KDK34_18375 [Leptospiraceae bacterium]|nr:hypothetical protein [Leptospiraceae bacterium]